MEHEARFELAARDAACGHSYELLADRSQFALKLAGS